jgi:hypothetical protein
VESGWVRTKNGRVDRVGSKSERDSVSIVIDYPYLKNTQDEKARMVVKSRASWFNSLMGKDFEAFGAVENQDLDNPTLPLLEIIKSELVMKLDNSAHVVRLNRKIA